ncbi:MAG: beta-propeller domain-containing protein [Candidatus Woesearchaeota archaeon]|jgi:uncharacterized secreted protein with C-terminal beta-propeller domain
MSGDEKMKGKLILGFFLIAALVVTGCIPQTPINGTEDLSIGTQEGLLGNNNVKDSNFKNVEEYQAFIKDHSSGSAGYYGRLGGVMMEATAAMKSSDSIDVSNSGSGVDFSGTNNQVIGVDEADMLKTDGEYIYTITENVVFIINSYPGKEAEVVSKIKFDKDYPTALFIEGNKLAVIGTVNDFNFLSAQGFSRNQGYTFVKIYDISNRAKPTLLKELKYEGQYNDARLIGSDMYLVSTFYPEYRTDYPTPLYFEGTVKKEMAVQNIHYFNIPYTNPSFVIVNSVNLEKQTTTDSVALTVEGYPNVYMSEDNLYLVYTEYINEWEFEQQVRLELIVPKLSLEDQKFVQKINAADSDILSRYEKQSKIMQVVEKYVYSLPEKDRDALQVEIDAIVKKRLSEYKYAEYTIINKIGINKGQVSIEANGKVPGHISNQFSMDEFEGNFRIATTISQRWSRFMTGNDVTTTNVATDEKIAIMPPNGRSESINNMYVLDSNLKELGAIEGLAKGEQIYSVRFMGDRAYVVTFRQVDPFFVIDLKDPSTPAVLGELKIPGFSKYLHPYDANTIIGIGRDATESGRAEGLKVSLFDVSDVANPKEIAKYVSDEKYASSTAEWEHKAFLFSKEKNLLVLPVYSYGYNGGQSMNGALVFKITKDSINLRGLVDHGSQNNYGPTVERSLYINDELYTKSPYLLRVNSLVDLSSIKNVTLIVNEDSIIKKY